MSTNKRICETGCVVIIAILVVSAFLMIDKISAIRMNIETSSGYDDEWPMFRHDARQIAYSKSSAPNTNNTYWSFNLSYSSANAPGEITPVVADDIVYLTYGGKVYALNATAENTDNRLLWNWTPPNGVCRSCPAVSQGKLIIVSSNGELFFLNATYQQLENRTINSVQIGASTSPTICNDTIYVGLDKQHNSRICALNLTSNTVMWTTSPCWEYGQEEPDYINDNCSPCVAYGRIYISANRQNSSERRDTVWVFNATNGYAEWHVTYDSGGPCGSPVTAAYGTVFAGADHNLAALDAFSNETIWSKMLLESFTGAAVSPTFRRIYGFQRYGGNDTNAPGISAFNITNGDRLWSFYVNKAFEGPGGGGACSPAVADNKVFIGDHTGMFYAVNADTGSLQWKFDTEERYPGSGCKGQVYGPAVAYGRVYIYTGGGKVYCFGESTPSQREWVHDVAMSSILPHTNPSKTVLCKNSNNYTVRVHFWVYNEGDFDEDQVQVTVFANDTAADTRNITIPFLEGIYCDLTWNASTFEKGNYTLSDSITSVSNETDLSDNSFTYGMVIVSKAGDITGPDKIPDDEVDVRDLYAVSKAWGTEPGMPKWNPNADINDDDTVDVKDYYIVQQNYGQ